MIIRISLPITSRILAEPGHKARSGELRNRVRVLIAFALLLPALLPCGAGVYCSDLTVTNTIRQTSSAGTNTFAGKVGIGVTSPSVTLEVKAGNPTFEQNASALNLAINSYSDTSTDEPRILLQKSHSDTLGTLAETQNGEDLGEIQFKGCDGEPGYRQGLRIAAMQDGAATSTRVPTRMEIYTDSSSDAAIRFVLKSDGKVGIGTNEPSATLDVAGTAKFRQGVPYVAPMGDVGMGGYTNSP